MKATDTFRTMPWCHNCAQAVANKWQKLYPSPDAAVDSMAAMSAGRAPQTVCGALYAAQQALPNHADSIKHDFEKAVGGLTCSDIKTKAKTPCPVCVDIADQLVEKYSNQ